MNETMKEEKQMEYADLAERREYRRVPLDMDIGVSLLESEAEASKSDGVSCRGRDISGGGISFYGSMRYQNGNILRLRIALADSRSTGALRVLGNVMWCKKHSDTKGYVTGVRFLNIYEDDFQSLSEYVQKSFKD